MTRRAFPGGDSDSADDGSPSGPEVGDALEPWDAGEDDDDLEPRPELGAWSQLAAAVLAVIALAAGVLGVVAVLTWLFR